MGVDDQVLDICFLPWLRLIQPIKLGHVEFVPAKNFISSLDDKAVANRVSKILSCYVDEAGRALPSSTVCQLNGRRGTEQMRQKQMVMIRQAVDALCFAWIVAEARNRILCPDYPSYCSVQQFELVRHAGPLGSDIFKVNKPNCSILNCSYDTFKFQRPLGAGLLPPTPARAFVDGLSSLLDSRNPIQEQVMRALEWVRLAHDDTGSVTELSKLVMMATAFEIVLHVTGETAKKKSLVRKMDALCRTESSTACQDVLDKETVEYSAMAWWMRDFYRLRSRVVHGSRIGTQCLFHTTAAGRFPHMQVADIAMAECVWRLLFEAGLVGDDCRRQATFLKSADGYYSSWEEDQIARDWAPRYAGTQDVLEKLGFVASPGLDSEPIL